MTVEDSGDERELRLSETRFREVFTTTPIGVAICDLDGTFVETNTALRDLLGYSEQDLRSATIHDLFDPEEAGSLAASYTELAEGTRRGLHERRNLVRADGNRAWTYLAVSMLRDADGTPLHSVTMIEDLRELSSLQDRLRHQALHDAMTGLPNRQYFRTRLEAALANLPKDATLTLYHLGLDGFELVNDGLGYEAGDTIIRAVAGRLEQLIDGETGMVARLGGTEFAILLRQSPDTPGIASFAALINEELAEPIYVGEHGIATSASIGVIQRAVGEVAPADMVWGADVALRRAETAGKRQWALFDPDRAPEEQIEAKLAAIMPGALELGEFEVGYRPLVSMDDRRLVAVEVQLSWQPHGYGRLGHTECLRLAERSGVTLSLRDWMLATAWKQLDTWHREGYRVRLLGALSPNQAQDPDLVARVREVLGDGELDPERMWLGMPATALLDGSGEARGNVHVLDTMGVRTALHDFRACPEELRCLRDLPVHAVRFSSDLVRLIHERDTEDAPEVRAVAGAIPLVRDCGVPIAVVGMDTEQQASWWHSKGCEVAAGSVYGDPVSAETMSHLLRDW
ncbi:PAS domain S-box-containing protein/diguanylate cyclase (GGDEF)-like protein [Halopolyspora algeriensis]|uniref:PAS domain S-box-containing protein/diguanylate cyclase (GGDEF)-like protein n=1 Tax=Halopolyspora algeriensis TaxID=1500506 RepID=A0A368VNR1_9ACTN|nr:EAL domain-containing protein [Halopolyspora algeriensis]RCW43158.1 PAS domain S-box-containing protein/diguanylate cyclase (GGDEF)-like protein [Halopolyspora algeriensis]TQM56216.1 PAS domain S-box-containing protein/diguanylate cyclase (GGDEF)-like protein [Halopolyspora algeriensis]